MNVNNIRDNYAHRGSRLNELKMSLFVRLSIIGTNYKFEISFEEIIGFIFRFRYE